MLGVSGVSGAGPAFRRLTLEAAGRNASALFLARRQTFACVPSESGWIWPYSLAAPVTSGYARPPCSPPTILAPCV